MQFNRLRRREFITLLGGAAAWPLAAVAQRRMPVIGFISSISPEELAEPVAGFHKGLGEAGYVEDRNVAIEYRWARGNNDRLPEFAADLVRRRVDVIATPGSPPATLAARMATTTIPIVFYLAGDPVKLGWVASLNRPGGNLTGVTTLGAELGAKRLELLHELVPTATLIAVLVNPRGTNAVAETFVRNVQAGARTLGLKIEVVHASTDADLNPVFATLGRLSAGGLMVAPDQVLYALGEQIAALAIQHRVPTAFQYRQAAAVGGLMSYGANAVDLFHLAGSYTGRILKGEKPGDLPVMQSTKFEFVINLKTARALGIEVSNSMQLLADEVIE
jgi:putative tryptophan/tyrosine transport system substrate-binding protein